LSWYGDGRISAVPMRVLGRGLYHVAVHELAERVLGHIRREELLRAGDRVGVAVSGGIDSVALLRLLIELHHELGIVLSIVHFNHKLRGAESEADQEFVAGLARGHGLEFHAASGDVGRRAAEEHSGVEAAARELRYGFFGELLGATERGEIGHDCDVPQGLKPESLAEPNGTAEAVPFPNPFVPPASRVTLNTIATGHTLDDQAETVLMRLIRGTGLRGLGGIHPRIVFEQTGEHEDGEHHGEIVRPLLGIRRRELEQYLTEIKQPWREDSSNTDSRFMRNRVRKLVLPLLEREFNPAVVESFSELAEIARDEEDYWENEISGWLGTVVQWSEPDWMQGLRGFDSSQGLVQIQPSSSAGVSRPEDTPQTNPASVVEMPSGARGCASGQGVLRSAQDDSDLRPEQVGPAVVNASVSRPWLVTEPKAVQRRVVKAIGEQAGIPLEFKHVEEILRFAAEDGPSGKELSLPLGWKVVREAEAMIFVTPDLRQMERVPDYEYPLAVPGRVFVPEIGVVIEALRVTTEITAGAQVAEYNPQQLLRAELLRGQLKVRNWRAGDRFWPAHTKAPKKIKELLQDLHVAQPERRLWPVAVSGDEIVWMRGFPVPARWLAKEGQEAVLIREMPWLGREKDFNRKVL
jgi:tRNA(Ile)-lysidine synthetase-like protein